jgi:glutaminyl-peptide cyclotransferase
VECLSWFLARGTRIKWAILISVTGVVSVAQFLSGLTQNLTTAVRDQGYKVLRTLPHDRLSFTEGLTFDKGALYESTGLQGHSTIQQLDPMTGEVVRTKILGASLFAEGLAVLDSQLIQLTWKSRIGFVYSCSDLMQQDSFHLSFDGWGLTTDGEHLIASDGSALLYILDHSPYSVVRQVEVRDGDSTVSGLNELEYVKGEVLANVWHTDDIARISLDDGRVKGWIHLQGLLSPVDSANVGLEAISKIPGVVNPWKEACLNGIAYDAQSDRLFVTGKLWPKIFEIQLVNMSERATR